MTIDRETLAAYAEGHLDAHDRQRVEDAIAADPALADEVAAHRALRARLQAHFAPVAQAPVPDRLIAAVHTAPPQADVIDFDAVRRAKAQKVRLALPRWAVGGAVAASLALGLVLGTQMGGDSTIGTRDGKVLAQGALDTALTTELSGKAQQPVRILLSLRDTGGRYCRVFEGAEIAGIACRQDGRWRIDQLQSEGGHEQGEYRQAGSAIGDIMAVAQAMAPDGALTAQAEADARASGWK